MWRVDTQLLAELNPAPPSSIFFMVRSFLNDPVLFLELLHFQCASHSAPGRELLLELTVTAEEPSTTGAPQGAAS